MVADAVATPLDADALGLSPVNVTTHAVGDDCDGWVDALAAAAADGRCGCCR